MAGLMFGAAIILVLCAVVYRTLGYSNVDPHGRNPDVIYGQDDDDDSEGHTLWLAFCALCVIALIGWGLMPA